MDLNAFADVARASPSFSTPAWSLMSMNALLFNAFFLVIEFVQECNIGLILLTAHLYLLYVC